MTIQETLRTIQNALKDIIQKTTVKSEKRAIVSVKSSALAAVSKYLFSNLHYRFIIASALQVKTGFEIYYHFSDDAYGYIINIRVSLPMQYPEIDTLVGLFPAANWIEREIHELFGIQFRNHPNLKKLISEGNWAEGFYPCTDPEMFDNKSK